MILVVFSEGFCLSSFWVEWHFEQMANVFETSGFVFSLPSSYPSAHVYHGSTIMKLECIARYQKLLNKLATTSRCCFFQGTWGQWNRPGPWHWRLPSRPKVQTPRRHHCNWQPCHSTKGCQDRIVWQLAIFSQPQGTRVLVIHTWRHTRNYPISCNPRKENKQSTGDKQSTGAAHCCAMISMAILGSHRHLSRNEDQHPA